MQSPKDGAVPPSSQVVHAIVGTAGHVDHGKTSLVRLLTGCETDRLPEEKARGMSIDLGFAPCLLPGAGSGGEQRLVGIVDVPGHSDFVRNMVAGAASVDVLLLVVAADDGVMPQTLEHMKIVRLLRKPQVMVALTKVDMVSTERLAQAREEVAIFLSLAGFPDAPLVPVSNKTGEGIDATRVTLAALVDRVAASDGTGRSRSEGLAFRMNIDRVFSVKGYGTVVTGVPLSGAAGDGEKVELLPAGKELTVRSVQVHGMTFERAFVGTRCAVNVRTVEAEEVARGMAIASPGVYRSASELVVTLENATEGPAVPLKRRFDARFHTGTASVLASVRLLGADVLQPAAQGFAHVKLAEPVVAAAGDRFILRALSPADTLGGGTVLSARPQRFRHAADPVARLEVASAAAARGDVLAAELLAGPDVILPAQEVVRLSQSTGESARRAVAGAVSAGILADLSGSEGGGEFAVISRLDEIRPGILKTLSRHHQAHPYEWGMSASLACAEAGISARSFERFADLLGRTGLVALRHGRLALASFRPDLNDRLLALRTRLMAMIEGAGAKAPARGNLMRDLGILEADMRVLEKIVTGDGSVLILDGHFMSRTAFDACRSKLMGLFEKTSTVEWKAFKEAIGTNRDTAVAVLDALDAEGLTRRTPSGRVLVK